ncbi:MAG TPA: hypothetical protein VHJ59_05850 [Nitrososphaera sp.]|jgi:hypothetical protein|nr:hypothetical protein [Nitrososphaera sp.]
MISIATEPERQKELDNKDEIHVLADIINAVYYQEYKITRRSGLQGNDIKEEEAILEIHILIILSRHNKSCPALAYCSIAFPTKL